MPKCKIHGRNLTVKGLPPPHPNKSLRSGVSGPRKQLGSGGRVTNGRGFRAGGNSRCPHMWPCFLLMDQWGHPQWGHPPRSHGEHPAPHCTDRKQAHRAEEGSGGLRTEPRPWGLPFMASASLGSWDMAPASRHPDHHGLWSLI